MWPLFPQLQQQPVQKGSVLGVTRKTMKRLAKMPVCGMQNLQHAGVL
jgi:hypothetical protein